MSGLSKNDLKCLFSRGSALLPHEYLMMLSRGIQISPIWDAYGLPETDPDGTLRLAVTRYDDPQGRAQAAVASAPYWAPRLSAQALAVKDVSLESASEVRSRILSTLGLDASDLDR